MQRFPKRSTRYIALTIATGAALATVIHPQAIDADTNDCSTVAACLLGKNASTGPGVEGDASSGPGVTARSTSGFGVSGKSISNHGIDGTSNSSFGVVGRTLENATTPFNARVGVLGEDASTNGNEYNAGVGGTSVHGVGIEGSSQYRVGVGGFSATDISVCGASEEIVCNISGNAGVGGSSTHGDGVFGSSLYSVGVVGLSDSSAGGQIVNFNDNAALFVEGGAQGVAGRAGLPLVQFVHQGGETIASFDQVGNLTLRGSLTENSTSLYRTVLSDGRAVTSYGAREATPTIEDLGEGRIDGGYAHVRLDPTFANTIDRRSRYMVFLTPEGNSAGLYVTSQTNGGFDVRENGSGRSSISFDYRIVARPLDAAAERLAPDVSRTYTASLHTPRLPVWSPDNRRVRLPKP